MKPLLTTLILFGVATMASAQSPDTSTIHAKAVVDSSFPGGSRAWLRFLNKTLRYPDKAVSKNIMGTVVVQFTVNADSTISDVRAIGGPTNGGLREESVRIVKLSGKWIPNVENGVSINSIKQVLIWFRLMDEPSHR
jgi:protein TonB